MRTWKNGVRRPCGYTLIELMVVMLVLGVLAIMALPLAELQVRRDKERDLKRALWEIREALDDYKRAADAGLIAKASGASGYPPTLDALVGGFERSDAGAAPKRLYFLRRIPRDPFADTRLSSAATWGLRSYESEASKPFEGSDVYDVYSTSDLIGLNGVPLRQW